MSIKNSIQFVNSSWKEIDESFDILEQFILTINETEDEESHHQIKQQLIFSIDIDDFDDDFIDEIEDRLDDFQDIAKKSKCFLPIINYRENETNFLKVACEMPYDETLSSYYSENKITESELKIHCSDLVEIYNILKEKEFMKPNLSLDDMSLALYREEQSIEYHICITPYAFIRSLLDSIEGKKARKYQPFENIFRFFDNEISKLNRGMNQFTEIINTLASDTDASHLFEDNQYLKSCEEERNIPQLNLDELEIEHLIGIGSYGAVMKVKNKIDNSVFALKVSNCYFSDYLRKQSIALYSLKNINTVQFFGFCSDKVDLLSKAEIIEENEIQRKKKINAVNEIIKENGNNNFAYMKMEYCEYGDLPSYVKKHYSEKNPMPVKEMEIIFGQLLQIAFTVHYKRLEHKDFKLENFLIKQIQPFVWIKLCNFEYQNNNHLLVYHYVGSLVPRHPEISSRNSSSIEDLYSLGIIMYFIIYTHHPFQGCIHEYEFIEKIRKGEVDYPALGEEYVPFIELTKDLISLKIQKPQVTIKNKQNFEIYWQRSFNHPISQRFLKAAAEIFEKHVPLTNQMK